MYALATEGQAFAIFEKKILWGVPIYGIIASSVPAFLAFMSVSIGSNPVECFDLKSLIVGL